MRILTIGNFGHGWDGSICDEEHIAGALEELGHEVHRQQREDRIYDHRGVKFDFIIIAQWDNYAPMLIPNMKDQDGCPIVYWAFDYQADGQEWHERLVYQADLYLSKRIADSRYPNWQWLAQDFAPQFLDRHSLPVNKDIDVLFTGTYLDFAHERNDTLKAVDEKFNLVIHSVNPEAWKERGFKNVNGPVMDDGLPELYARAKVILSIDHTIEAGYWSDRNAQIMACGGYVLFRYVPLSESTFGPGVDYFYNVEDCLKKIESALANDSYRKTVADIGYDLVTRANRLRVSGRVWDLMKIVEGIL